MQGLIRKNQKNLDSAEGDTSNTAWDISYIVNSIASRQVLCISGPDSLLCGARAGTHTMPYVLTS